MGTEPILPVAVILTSLILAWKESYNSKILNVRLLNFLAFLFQSDLRTVPSCNLLICVTSLGCRQDCIPILQMGWLEIKAYVYSYSKNSGRSRTGFLNLYNIPLVSYTQF